MNLCRICETRPALGHIDLGRQCSECQQKGALARAHDRTRRIAKEDYRLWLQRERKKHDPV